MALRLGTSEVVSIKPCRLAESAAVQHVIKSVSQILARKCSKQTLFHRSHWAIVKRHVLEIRRQQAIPLL